MILELNLKISVLISFFLLAPSLGLAEPETPTGSLPAGEAMYVTDTSILKKLNLGTDGEPIWCYSNLANSLLISSADRERQRCELKSKQDLERQKLDCDFKLEQLSVELTSLTKRHENLMDIKNKQVEELTKAALKRPNDYSIWWATGGFSAGILTSLIVFYAVR